MGNGLFKHIVVRIMGTDSIGQIVEVDKLRGTEPLYYVESADVKKWFRAEDLERIV